VTSAQASWLVACESRKLRPVSEPRNEDKVLLIGAKRRHSWDRRLVVSMVILLRQHPHPAIPHRGGGSSWPHGSVPQRNRFAIERHRTSPMTPMPSGSETPVRCVARSADPGGRLASDGHRADGADPGRSVVNEWGRSRDVENRFIVEGSIFVTAARVNPTRTIRALALYVANSIKQRLATLFD
jgi:hypothetical protein